jgi:hypothetical protein
MAGDWIKMRVDLQTHPKVVRILSATGTDKFRVLGGLHAVWSVFDTHSEDGRLKGYTPDTLDHVIGWPGFGAAMMAVGWLAQEDGETLVLPEFSEHNGQSAKRRAEDQKRKRNGRRESEKEQTDCGQDADKKQTREREEKKEQKTAPKVDLLAEVSPQVASDFRALRTKLRAPITETAMNGIRREAAAAGMELEAALAMCCERGWRGFKAEWVGGDRGKASTAEPTRRLQEWT